MPNADIDAGLRPWRLVPVAVLAVVAAGCGDSYEISTTGVTVPPLTATTPTVPHHAKTLVAKRFPQHLSGSLSYTVDQLHLDPNKPDGSLSRYRIDLRGISLRLSKIVRSGGQQVATYTVTGATTIASGSQDVTDAKCETTHTVWHARKGAAVSGVLGIDGTAFNADVSFELQVPLRGTTTTHHCGSNGGTEGTISRKARITGAGALTLHPTGSPRNRFVVIIQNQTVSAGPSEKGGFTIIGDLRPPVDAAPVTICRRSNGRLSCPDG